MNYCQMYERYIYMVYAISIRNEIYLGIYVGISKRLTSFGDNPYSQYVINKFKTKIVLIINDRIILR